MRQRDVVLPNRQEISAGVRRAADGAARAVGVCVCAGARWVFSQVRRHVRLIVALGQFGGAAKYAAQPIYLDRAPDAVGLCRPLLVVIVNGACSCVMWLHR